jgi:hypothetical protein
MKGIIGRLRAVFSSLFEFEEYEDYIRVTTALLLPSGDYAVVYVRKLSKGNYEVSDNGETLHTIGNLGWHISIEELDELCNDFCVQIDGAVLRCPAEGSIDLARSIIWTAQAIALVISIASMRNK